MYSLLTQVIVPGLHGPLDAGLSEWGKWGQHYWPAVWCIKHYLCAFAKLPAHVVFVVRFIGGRWLLVV